MTRHPFAGIPALLLSLAAIACSPGLPGVALNTDATPAPRLIELVNRRTESVASMTGRGTVSFDSGESSGSAFMQVNLRKPDSLLVRFRGPFGIEGGTLFLSGERYLFYNALENRVVTGDPRSRSVRSVIPFELTPDQVLDAFTGQFRIPGDPRAVREYVVEEGLFRLETTRAGGACAYWVDPGTLLVMRFRQYDRTGTPVLEGEIGDIRETGGVALPRRIVLAFPGSSRRVAVYYDRITPNPDEVSFAYTVPPSARKEVR
jgi:hypothetical protein